MHFNTFKTPSPCSIKIANPSFMVSLDLPKKNKEDSIMCQL